MKSEIDPDFLSDINRNINNKDRSNSKVISENHIINNESSKNNIQSPSDYCIMDHSGKRFSCIKLGNCYEQPNCFKFGQLQENLDFHQLEFHPEDRIVWCGEAFPDILKFIKSELAIKFPDYKFIFNHRYIRNDGRISQFMHEGSISFTGDNLLPVLNLKVFFEIADGNTDNTITLTIFKYSDDHGYQKIFTKMYGLKNNSLLTDRELEIIKLCYEGLSSKMIAEKLNLSFHTVKNHKRNCMEKTKTHNITKLIYYCLKNNWL
jgi:DNA-binding CsgD family transcriptional regulator